MTVLATLQFTVNEPSFDDYYAQLLASGARVIVLFCGTSDASRFIEGAYDAGIGGEGYVWLGSDAVSNPQTMEGVSNLTKRMAIFKGFFGLTASRGAGTDAYDAFAARISALPPTTGTATQCDLEVSDDDGPGSESSMLWAADHDGDPSTPLECAGSDNQVQDSYAPFVYDAVFAVAHALHDLIEVQGESVPVNGDKRARRVQKGSSPAPG